MSATDFIITVHALERFEERFPDLIDGKTDQQVGAFIHTEVMDALEARRFGKIPPIELAAHSAEGWEQRNPGAYMCWTREKTRGYAIVEDKSEGMLVTTVLFGESRDYAMRKLKKGLPPPGSDRQASP